MGKRKEKRNIFRTKFLISRIYDASNVCYRKFIIEWIFLIECNILRKSSICSLRKHFLKLKYANRCSIFEGNWFWILIERKVISNIWCAIILKLEKKKKGGGRATVDPPSTLNRSKLAGKQAKGPPLSRSLYRNAILIFAHPSILMPFIADLSAFPRI